MRLGKGQRVLRSGVSDQPSFGQRCEERVRAEGWNADRTEMSSLHKGNRPTRVMARP
jgi:hypothetical protein